MKGMWRQTIDLKHWKKHTMKWMDNQRETKSIRIVVICSVNKKFAMKLDKNPKLIVFKNGTFDLKERRFSKSLPDDCCSATVGYDYKEVSRNSKEMKEVDDFINKVYVDRNLREYFLDFCCSLLLGGNISKLFLIFKGEQEINAKSKIEELLQAVFGSYCIILPPSFITGKRTQSSGATPELIRCKYAKLVILQEPNKGDTLNSGIIKEMTGGDKIYARGLFEKELKLFQC